MASVSITRVALQFATSGGSQVFLGAPWVRAALQMAPKPLKRRAALELLSISPHYFYRLPGNLHLGRKDFLESEIVRNSESRRLLIDRVVKPHIGKDFTVLDYGCGPGFLALHASAFASRVIACDISSGALSCASVLNGADNIDYVRVADDAVPVPDESVDLVYSFAVIQHVSDSIFAGVLQEWRRVMKPGATAICHVVITGTPGWRTEAAWTGDRSLKGRARMAAALHCFAREPEAVRNLVEAAGFREFGLSPMADLNLDTDDDLGDQHLIRFTK